jgi:carbamoyl-phosphate synthase small subunit
LRQPALLALADGTLFRGESIGSEGETVGEVVFNTALTGYQEILTDPSYTRQIVTLTYPHIGNTGINPEDEEGAGVMAAGLIIRDLPLVASNWRSKETLEQYLCRHRIVGIANIDTRKLTRVLREKGAQNGCLVAGEKIDAEKALAAARGFAGLNGMDLAKEVTTKVPFEWAQGSWTLEGGLPTHPENIKEALPNVVVYDYGVKRNILRMLVDRGCRLTVVPAQMPADQVLAMKPDGVLLANGPGDPAACTYAIESIQQLLKTEVPVFGICLGHQLLALASGARTLKMKFGHHGANHPVIDIDTGRVMITSQNHGFAVDEATLPKHLRATHRSLFDGSLQGVARTDRAAFSFQGHPEASPGPKDVSPLFDKFVASIKDYKK